MKNNMTKRSKIIAGIAGGITIITLVAAIIWFSMPIEQRNMVSFMMKKGPAYENYKEYQTINKNTSALLPTSFEPAVAVTTNDDYNSNITVITEIVLNERSKMVKKAIVQPNVTTAYPGWRLIADEGFEEGVNTFGPSPLSYLTCGVAANLHTQILRAAEILNVELENVKVEVLNKFHWEEMLSAEGAGFLGETHTNIIIESGESEETIRNLKTWH